MYVPKFLRIVFPAVSVMCAIAFSTVAHAVGFAGASARVVIAPSPSVRASVPAPKAAAPYKPTVYKAPTTVPIPYRSTTSDKCKERSTKKDCKK
ncbi:hypothetical protein SHAb15599_00096 [Acinetobacter phage SH-Ab 15599]|nr:hypothetical protein SHAb15599_00096 [Acinetobacter phage SH-Ab 15599]